METMYVLNWDSDDTNTDTYGSQIEYRKDKTVAYENALQPAGKKIHWWETKFFGDPDPLKASRYGSKRLPQLPRNQKFSLVFQGTVIPEKSLGLTVRSLSADGQLLDQKMTLDSKLDFKLSNETKNYEIALVKFNNNKLVFESLLMIPDKILKDYQVKANLLNGYIDLVPNNGFKSGKIMVRTFHRVVDAVPLPKEQHLEPLRIVLTDDYWDAERLQKVSNDFTTKYQLQAVNWTASDLKSQILLNDAQVKN